MDNFIFFVFDRNSELHSEAMHIIGTTKYRLYQWIKIYVLKIEIIEIMRLLIRPP